MLNPNPAQPQSETALLTRLKNREPRAYRDLMQKYNQRLYRVARSILHDDFEAEDVVQETYLRAFANLENFKGKARLGTWLTRIAINEALTRLRRSSKTETVEFDEDHQAEIIPFPLNPPNANPERAAMQSQIRQLLEQSIGELPLAFRTVLIARDVEGLSIEETAELLEIKPETVKTRLHRARTLLRGSLDKELTSSLAETFTFRGERCERITSRVMQRLRF